MKVHIQMDEGIVTSEMKYGEIKLIPLAEGKEVKATIEPASSFDVGEGPGKKVETMVIGGVAGVLLDARGRPLYLPEDDGERRKLLVDWFTALDLYPRDPLKELVS
ncbi:hypothetical protein FJY84_01845 [Candidatus Bathyarchaeota archaeon]|nr:hypothetical protein [Candidatus Bathyarchaeota archaeon]